jgi:DNA-binding MarR family transcriptional regulator
MVDSLFDNKVVELSYTRLSIWRRSARMPVVSVSRPGYELPLLLVGAFRLLVDELHAELALHGHPDARPLHGFALQAVGSGTSISELGRRLGVSKQAAAKTAASLERLGYVRRASDPADARATRIERSARGDELLELSARIFARSRARLVDRLGAERIRALEDDLEAIVGASAFATDVPGWLATS